MPRFCFFNERQVGIGSAAENLEPYVRAQGHAWRDVTYREDGGLLERLPLLPEEVTGTARGFLQVRELLRRETPDGLFFLTHNPAVFHPRALRRVPTVLWTDVTPRLLDAQADHYDHGKSFAPVQHLKHRLVCNTFRTARFVVGWSHWARRSFIQDYGVPPERARVIHPGLDLSRWTLPQRTRAQGLPRILFVGGHFERKGGALLLQVFRDRLRGKAELDIVTRDAVSPEPGVRVHRGINPGSPELLRSFCEASVFALPTQGDCFSMASLEAMAMGLPVIVSDVGGIAEIVEHERSGMLIAPRDGRALGESLSALVEQPERCVAFGARGRAIVERKFDASKSAQALLALMNEAAEQA